MNSLLHCDVIKQKVVIPCLAERARGRLPYVEFRNCCRLH